MRVLPDSDQLVYTIMAHDVAPGYVLARGIAAHPGDGYPEMLGFLKCTAEPSAPAARG